MKFPMDKLSPARRSENMRRIRSRDTSPERVLRKLIHSLGYRFRLHRKDLPGKPDLVFPGRNKVIFIHGCFWHLHSGCREGRVPSSRGEYWGPKLARNKSRDAQNACALLEDGWDVLVVWECELKNMQAVTEALQDFLGTPGSARRYRGSNS